MITKEMLSLAWRQGKITLKTNPFRKTGTVAAIGGDWFYFGGITADEMSPEEYRKHVPEKDIIRKIREVLDNFRIQAPDVYAYCESVLSGPGSRWAEIRCDHMDQDTRFWSVDAWETADGSEAKTIAYIDDITGRVLYTEPMARVDKYAQEVIQDRIAGLECPVRIKKRPGGIDIGMPSGGGTLTASLEPDKTTGAGYDAVFLGLEASRDPYVYLDLAAVRMHNGGELVDILTWTDIDNEDYTTRASISGSRIKDLVRSCREQEEER